MKSKVLASVAALMAVGATCAFAANPFVDVPTDSWAYKSVVELADAGIIQGVDGSYFQGERNITRYEAAEMVAKAMAHMDRATVEQRALINKLADEYADELNNLGVRVSNLENKVGNIKFTGDARLRYRYQNSYTDNDGVKHGGKENDKSWDYRIRLRGKAQINDRMTATLGLSTDSQSFGDNGAASDTNIFADDIKVDYNTKSFGLSLGRTDKYKIGGPRAYGYIYGDVFDRAEMQFRGDKFAVTAGYGKFKMGSKVNGIPGMAGEDEVMDGVKTGYAEIEAFFGNGSAAGVYYNDFTVGGGSVDNDFFRGDDLWGAYASVNFGSKWNLLANYENVGLADGYKTQYTKDDSADLWVGRLTYGKANMSAPKSWDIWVEYIDAEDGVWLGGSTDSWRFADLMDNITSWGAGVDYIFAKNAKFSVMQSFATEAKDGDMTDPEEQTRAEFVFAF